MERHELRLELLKIMPLTKTGEPVDIIDRCRQFEAYCYEGVEPAKSDSNPFASTPSETSEPADNPHGAGQTDGKDRQKHGPAKRR